MPASAPIPGVGKRKDAARAAKQILSITIRGVTRKVAINNVPLRERLTLRQQTTALTGSPMSIESLVEPLGLESLMVLWWLARRAEGETDLQLEDVAADFDDLKPEDVQAEIDEPEGSDPEA